MFSLSIIIYFEKGAGGGLTDRRQHPLVGVFYLRFYLNSFDAAFIEDERKVIFLIGILSLRSS